MRRFGLLAVMVALLLVSACAVPQTAQEFRQMAPGAFMGTVVDFEVNRSIGKVGRSYKKMAPKCLNKRLTTTTTRRTRYGDERHTIEVDYNPTVIVKKDRAEIHLQQEFVSGVVNMTKLPPGGQFLLVADAVPAGRNKTKVKIYTASIYDNLIKAVKNWSSGKHLCPDLTQ